MDFLFCRRKVPGLGSGTGVILLSTTWICPLYLERDGRDVQPKQLINRGEAMPSRGVGQACFGLGVARLKKRQINEKSRSSALFFLIVFPQTVFALWGSGVFKGS